MISDRDIDATFTELVGAMKDVVYSTPEGAVEHLAAIDRVIDIMGRLRGTIVAAVGERERPRSSPTVVDWRKWGLGLSVEFGDPAFLRLWLGPVRVGWKYGGALE